MNNNDLHEFLRAHIARATAADQDIIDMAFLHLKVIGEPDAQQLRALLAEYRGDYIEEIDLFDGAEHGYIEIGAWLGDQGAALCLMALGKALGLWDLLTPMLMLGLTSDDPMTKTMAGMGMITIVAAKP